MIQENRMPIEFEALHKGSKRTISVGSIEWFEGGTILINSDIPLSEVILRQRIGATDSSDPPQELYLGDLIGFNLDKKDVVGEIIWLNFSVWVRLWRNENTLSYLSVSHVLDYFKIKRLGSRYTKEGQEILEKVGLEKS